MYHLHVIFNSCGLHLAQKRARKIRRSLVSYSIQAMSILTKYPPEELERCTVVIWQLAAEPKKMGSSFPAWQNCEEREDGCHRFRYAKGANFGFGWLILDSMSCKMLF